jgi:hypothetical protein
MKVTSGQDSQRITRRFTIEADQPVVAMAYSNPPKKVVIERGSIDYTFDSESGRWVAKDAWAITVAGTVLKKDGTPSKNDHSRRAQEKYLRGQREYIPAEGWEWLQLIIDLLRPTGHVSMMTLNEAEVKA